MDRFRVEAFIREFPFLEGLAEKDRIEDIRVSRISPDFLKRKPREEYASGSRVDIHDIEKVYLLDEDGAVLTEVKGVVDAVDHRGEDTFEEGETVGEALARLDDPNAVAYALNVHTGYEVVNHHSIGGYEVIIYKPPKGFTLRGWWEEQIRRAAVKVASEIAEIDAEGGAS